MDIQILPLRERLDAVPQIAAWQFAEWGYLYPADTLETWTRELARQLGGAGIPTVLLAVDASGTPIGTASLIAHDIADDLRTPWLASALVWAVERRAAGLGIARLYLFTTKQERLYAGLGWRKLERRDYRGEMIQVMEKALAGP